MKHYKFKTNKLTAAASQDQSPKPQQEYVFSNLPVSGIQGQTEMKHTKFKTNKLTTAAWTKAENDKTSKKGFTWGGSDGVDHVAREVLQHGVANRGSRGMGEGTSRLFFSCSADHERDWPSCKVVFPGWQPKR